MRVAYLSHVDSRWIKQRPQFLAEALGQRPGLQVGYFCSSLVRKGLLVGSQRLEIRTRRLPLLPQRYRQRSPFADLLLSWLSAQLLLAWRPDILIVTHARHIHVASIAHKRGIRVFYDCMDLNRLFPDVVSRDLRNEVRLVQMAEQVFCSSRLIEEEVLRLDPDAIILSVPNALAPETIASPTGPSPVDRGVIRYVGTVSTWFDMAAILALAALPNVRVEVIGPIDVDVPNHDSIVWRGVASHPEAMEAMQTADVLVLPFIITKLVEAVDPVKVYEYIASGRPVICAEYAQLDHFGGLIEQYGDPNELISAARRALGERTKSPAELQEFITANSWDERSARIAARLR